MNKNLILPDREMGGKNGRTVAGREEGGDTPELEVVQVLKRSEVSRVNAGDCPRFSGGSSRVQCSIFRS